MRYVRVGDWEIPIKWSHSFKEKAACPTYFFLNYGKKDPDKLSRVPGARGSALHSAIDDLMRFTEEEKIKVKDIPFKFVREKLAEYTTPLILSETGMMTECMRNWHDKYEKSEYLYGIEEKVALDENFKETDWSNGSFRGILDVVDIQGDTCIVTDWKSQINQLTKAEIEDHEQMTHYCWLAWRLYPHLKKFKIRIWYLRYKYYQETERTIEQLKRYEESMMVAIMATERMSNFDPVPGAPCHYCDYQHKCPLLESDMLPDAANQESALKVANRLVVMKEWVGTAQKSLKDYVRKNGGVRVGKGVYEERLQRSTSYDPRELSGVLKDHGLEFLDVANADGRKIKKLVKEAVYEGGDETIEADLEAIAKEKRSNKFQWWKNEE